jgi:hypothetical protein
MKKMDFWIFGFLDFWIFTMSGKIYYQNNINIFLDIKVAS